MKRYQFLYALLVAGMLCTFSLSFSTAEATPSLVEFVSESSPTAQECQVLKAAAEASQQNYGDLYSGFSRGAVTIEALPDDHYCVVYGSRPNDFIIIEILEEE
ncbi:MAG: hypothetical protein AAF998_25975 [Bacteroidota bacterium]